MNRKQIRDLVIETTGRTDKDSLINSAINIALAKVSTSRLWNDLLTDGSVTLTLNALSVALSSSLRRLSEVRIIDGLSSYRLIIRPKTWVKKHYPNIVSMSSGRPRIGYVQGTTLYFAPPTDSAYVSEYSFYKLHADLSDDTTVIDIPQADEPIISYTTYWVFKSLQLHEDAAQWLGDYNLQIQDAKYADISSAEESIGEMRGVNLPGSFMSADAWLNPFIPSVDGSVGGIGF